IFRLETEGVAFVCLSYLGAANSAQIRYAVRRLRRKLPRAHIMIGLWSETGAAGPAPSLLRNAKADTLASTRREATRICIESIRPDPKRLSQERDAQPAIADNAI